MQKYITMVLVLLAVVVKGEFKSPTNIPGDYPVEWDRYQTDILPDPSLCEILQPMLGSSVIVWDGWNGTLGECVRECSYDSNCMGGMFSKRLYICTKGAELEITDNTDTWMRRRSEGWSYFTKKGYPVPYMAQKCFNYINEKNCNRDSECKWNVSLQYQYF